MSSDNKKIQIIMEDLSYLARSFENAFSDSGVEAQVVDVSSASIHMAEEKIYAYIIFTGKQLLRNSVNLKVLVDMAIKAHIPLFAIGNAEELAMLWKIVPKHMVIASFVRPIKVLDIAKNIVAQLNVFYSSKRKTILCIDDSGVLLRKMKALLEDKYEVVLVNSGAMAIKFLTLRRPDLILLDIMLPGDDGYTILEKIRQMPEVRDVPVIMVTAKGAEFDKVKGLDLGADDYITKPFGMMEFISRVKAVLRRGGSRTEETLVHGPIQIRIQRHEVLVHGQKVELTLKEFELLKYLVENRGIVLTRDQLLTRIWGYDFDGETRTVDVHVRTLRQKLGEAGACIETVRGVGYRMGDEA